MVGVALVARTGAPGKEKKKRIFVYEPGQDYRRPLEGNYISKALADSLAYLSRWLSNSNSLASISLVTIHSTMIFD